MTCAQSALRQNVDSQLQITFNNRQIGTYNPFLTPVSRALFIGFLGNGDDEPNPKSMYKTTLHATSKQQEN